MKALKVTISGSYRAAENKIMDYANVTGIIPYQQEDVAVMHVRDRYARMWIMKDERFKERLYSVRECYVDDMVEVEAEFDFVGKDIREMSQEDLQDLATAKDLRLIPLYKITSERQARTLAYADYSDQVLKEVVDYKAVGFNLMKQPPVIVHDSAWRKDTTRKISNEEVLANESTIGQSKSAMSRKEMEAIAKSQHITYHPSISDENLHKRIYG